MKQFYIFICIASFSCMQASHEYWKNSEQNLFMQWYHYLAGPSIEQQIPMVLQIVDQQTVQEKLTTYTPCQKAALLIYNHKKHEYNIEKMTECLTSGPLHETFKACINRYPALQNQDIELRLDKHNVLVNSRSVKGRVILASNFLQCTDIEKLFLFHHELQHIIYNDVENDHVQKILHVPTCSKELHHALSFTPDTYHPAIIRYAEYRSDTCAMQAIQCPYCLQELMCCYESYCTHDTSNTYNPDGYLYPWQFKSSIEQRLQEKKCCLYHHNNGKIVNPCVNNNSTLLERLELSA